MTDVNGVPSTERQVFQPADQVQPAAITKFWKLWSRGILSRNETIDGFLLNGVSEVDAIEIFDTQNHDRFLELMAKYGC